jgi:hypothetical protein
MGNNRSKEMKKVYEKGFHKIKKPLFDSNLGSCEIIEINGHNGYCIQRELDPSEFNGDIEMNTINNEFTKECKHICEFYFVTHGNDYQYSYKIIYEYGKQIKEKVTLEKRLWNLIRQVLDATVFLQNAKMHYPILSKKYIIQKDEKTYKLLNPFCFPEFIREFVQIYLAKKEQVSSKTKYSKECIKRNAFQFPFVILSIITDFSEIELKQDFSILQNSLKKIEKQFSPGLVEFLYYLLQEKPSGFVQIKNKLDSLNINYKVPNKKQRYPPRARPLDPSVLVEPGFNGSNFLSQSGTFRNSIVQNKMAQPQKPKKPIRTEDESFNESYHTRGKFI